MPTRNWFSAILADAERIRRLPRWSISSTSLYRYGISMSFFMTSTCRLCSDTGTFDFVAQQRTVAEISYDPPQTGHSGLGRRTGSRTGFRAASRVGGHRGASCGRFLPARSDDRCCRRVPFQKCTGRGRPDRAGKQRFDTLCGRTGSA